VTAKTWIIFVVIVAALFGGLWYASARDKIDVSDVKANSVLAATEASGGIEDHTYGNKKAKVIILEYGDYQCPGCASAYEPLKTVYEKYQDDVAFVFRNYPLVTIHPNAKAAAAAAEAAGLMGKYWEMHDILYQSQNSWSNASASERTGIFETYAQQIGLDRAKFKETLEKKNDQIAKKISYDQALGAKQNVSGTPTIFVNGKLVNQKVKDGKLVPDGTNGAAEVWSDAELFDKFILQPAFKEAGVDTSAEAKDTKKE
jgi:protein-disulfide isomerase